MKKTRADLEAELNVVEGQITPASLRLDELVKEFSEAVIPDVRAWVKKEAMREMEENHTKVNEAGGDFVARYKADVFALLENMDETTRISLGQRETWPHNVEISQHDSYPSSQNNFFSAVFKRAVSSLGKVLDAHGLINERGQNPSWRRQGSRGFEYVYHSGFDGKKYESIATYEELLRRHLELKQSALRLKVEIEKAKTRDLWDEA